MVDTPGFSQVDLTGIESRQLAGLFPEMDVYNGQCHFGTCLHLDEPGCAVRAALVREAFPAVRYEHYRQFMAEIVRNSGKGWRREGR